METNIKQEITITGRNWNDIFQLPCVSAIHKDNDDRAAVSLRPTLIHDYNDDEGGWCCAARIGDTLVEYQDGTWEVNRKDQQPITPTKTTTPWQH